MGKFSRLGNDLYNGEKSIDFIGRKWLWYAVSSVIVLIAIGGWSVKGLNFGIEFTGGNQYTVSVQAGEADQDTADELRQAVADTGIEDASSPIVTTQGDQAVVVQTEPLTDDEGDRVLEAIVEVTGVDPDTDVSPNEIGPSWGEEVAERSLIGLLVFLVALVLFIWAYFREWKMAVGALVAVAHDVVITIGIYAISGFEVTPASVTGLLTILGFSLYDTVVVFDQVRNNTKNLRQSRRSYAQAANLAVNQTLVRSINTSIVALIPVGVILYVSAVQLGASSLKDLSLALFVGTAAGVYSSIFIATPLVAHLKQNETEVLLAEKRAKSRAKAGDRYATVPNFTEDAPARADDAPARADTDRDLGDDDVDEGDRDYVPDAPAPRPAPQMGASGRGRTVPQARGPVQQSSASGRQQPVRQTKSKRKKP